MPHTCSTLVLHCIDFRLGKAIKQFLEEKNLLGNCDIVSVAGATKNLVSPSTPSDREFVLRQIDIAKRLHGINEVILMNHTDCGAYGGRDAFNNRDEERARHREDLQAAVRLIKEKYPDLTIWTVLPDIEASGEINFVEF